ncbi:hypothetical protein ACS8Y6_00115 [Salinisphaera sp. RV14]|uniref:hypothetical protein n=1 Tax=unclassified Salinisphaera TaxID=2649847 RepID=UPI003F872109
MVEAARAPTDRAKNDDVDLPATACIMAIEMIGQAAATVGASEFFRAGPRLK